MPTIEVGDVKINYVVEGEGDEIIMFVHGLGESHETWIEQLKFFPKNGFKTVALDLRGHGKSSIPKERITIEGFANDVISLAKKISSGKLHFCGYSMGAIVLLEAYKRKPNIFKTLILEATTPSYPPAQTELLENMSMDEIARQVSEFAVGPNASNELKEDIYRIVSQTDKEVYIESAEAATSRSYDDILPNIEVPTLIITGELDFIAPPEVAERMHNRIKNSELKILKGIGHMPHREAPDEFNIIVKEFIEKNR